MPADKPLRKFVLDFKHPLAAHLCILSGAAASTLVILSQTPAPYGDIARHVLDAPQAALIELLAMLLIMYLFYFISGVVWLSVGIPSLLIYIICLVNKYKVFLRGDPLMPTDVILGGEAFGIVLSSSIKPGAGSIVLLILIIFGGAALCAFFRFRRERPGTRLIGGLATALLMALSFFTVFTNDAVYESIPIKNNIYNMVNEYNSKGFILAFIYHTRDLDPGALRPEGYSPARAREILAGYETGSGQDRSGGQGGSGDSPVSDNSPGNGGLTFKPDVIFLMSEAFWDITEIAALDFSGEDGVGDPIPFYRGLEKECATGGFFADVYGGGTDTTEFSLLTGHSVANFPNGISSAYKFLVRKDADSIVRAFAANGYSAVAIHPGFAWFYNRQNVYPWLGFDDFIDISAFDEAVDISGNYISDEAMTEALIGLYDEYAGTGRPPFFCFTVSIQNHGPYDAGFMYGETPKNYLTTPEITLSIKGDYAVTNYIRGLRDADASLKRLTGYLEPLERPVVLLFFGDHLPGLGSNFSAYRELGYPIGYDGGLQEKINVFKGRYLIWANGAARAEWPEYEAMKSEMPRMSVNYLGIYLMGRLGLDLGAYENFVESMRGSLPVHHALFHGTDGLDGGALYAGKPGEPGTAADEALLKLLGEYRIVQYYKIFDEKIEEVIR